MITKTHKINPQRSIWVSRYSTGWPRVKIAQRSNDFKNKHELCLKDD